MAAKLAGLNTYGLCEWLNKKGITDFVSHIQAWNYDGQQLVALTEDQICSLEICEASRKKLLKVLYPNSKAMSDKGLLSRFRKKAGPAAVNNAAEDEFDGEEEWDENEFDDGEFEDEDETAPPPPVSKDFGSAVASSGHAPPSTGYGAAELPPPPPAQDFEIPDLPPPVVFGGGGGPPPPAPKDFSFGSAAPVPPAKDFSSASVSSASPSNSVSSGGFASRVHSFPAGVAPHSNNSMHVSSSGSSSNFASRAHSIPAGVVPHSNNDLASQDYYSPHMDRRRAEYILQNSQTDGAFVIRNSSKQAGEFSMSLFYQGHVRHLRIRRRHDNHFALGEHKTGEKFFVNIVELVAYHKTQPINLQSGGFTVLTYGYR